MNSSIRNVNNSSVGGFGEFAEGGGVVSERALASDGHLAFSARGENGMYLSWKIIPY